MSDGFCDHEEKKIPQHCSLIQKAVLVAESQRCQKDCMDIYEDLVFYSERNGIIYIHIILYIFVNLSLAAAL